MPNTNHVHYNAMYKLRYEQGYTLQEISDMFSISRERIRQIIGNSGKDFITKFNQSVAETIDITKNSSFSSIVDDVAKSDIRVRPSALLKALQPKLSSTHHKMDGGNAETGEIGEREVSDKLTSIGIQNTLMPAGHPFDILLDGGIKIDVKSATVDRFYNKKAIHKTFKFQVQKSMGDKYCDFFVCLVVPFHAMFVIPWELVQGKTSLYLTYPVPQRNWSWIYQYESRFDLLS